MHSGNTSTELIWHRPCLMTDSKRLVRSSSPGPRTHAEPNEHITLTQLTSHKSALCFSFTSSYVTLSVLLCCLWDCHVSLFISSSGSDSHGWIVLWAHLSLLSRAYMVCSLGQCGFEMSAFACRCSLELIYPLSKIITILYFIQLNINNSEYILNTI